MRRSDSVPRIIMTIVAHLSHRGVPIADITYRAGLHVEVRVAKEFQLQTVCFSLTHSGNERLEGNWEEALDNYFNEGLFDSRFGTVPGEMRRVGSAREHKSLFKQAVHALFKDLQAEGYKIQVEFI
jgi:hypothetical protein